MLIKGDIHTLTIVLLDSSIALLDDAFGIVEVSMWFKIPAYICGIVYMIFRALKMKADWQNRELDRETKAKNLILLDQVTEARTHAEKMQGLQAMVDNRQKIITND